ncbi:phage holin [Niallia alba]|uniref:Phage holin n=1 Tax=Niallia circulans TaxID=1397 RepID=A0A941GC54_NIACI|nr:MULTISPECIES: phage holin [Niallia]MCB5236694.1 phage holin [Niallia circulans]MED3792145.1 phage holin [Niallia alba]
MDKGTVIRTIALLVTWVNLILVKYELQPISVLDDEDISMGITLIISVWAWFKNNYVTAKGKKQKKLLIEHNLVKKNSNE